MSSQPQSKTDYQRGFPDPTAFYFDIPLYERYDLSEDQGPYVSSIEFNDQPIDAYCIYCEDRSLFERVRPSYEAHAGVNDHVFSVSLQCGRKRTHTYQFIFKVADLGIEKIGQYPSIADISLPQLIRYRRILGAAMYKEFNRAVGLAAHGVGIGSFVYLRRILEILIESAHQQAKNAATWNEQQYLNCRTVERIEMLKGHLPDFMVRNRLAYGILSKGIHELTEEECSKYFKPLKSVIELILNEHMLQQEHQRNVHEAEQSLVDVQQQLSK